MTIPSKSSFKSYFSTSQWIANPEWIQEAEKKENDKDLYRFLFDIEEQKETIRNNAYDHPVAVWLFNDLNAKKAFRSLQFREKPRGEMSIEKYVHGVVKRSREDRPGYPSFRLKHFIEDHPCEYLSSLILAFYNYFYSDRWRKVTQRGRDAKKIVGKAITQIARTEKCLKELEESFDEFYFGREIIHFDNLFRMVERIRQKVDLLHEDGALNIPSRRLDDMARERVLVFDLATAIRRRYRKDRPTAIAHFMNVEGVINPPTERAIVRLLSDWREARKEAWARFETERAARRLESAKKYSESAKKNSSSLTEN